MKCDRCNETIPAGDDHEMHGQVLCDDCYIDALSPTKACDPWAVHSAKSLSDGEGGRVEMTATQTRILEILKESGGAMQEMILEQVGLKPAELEREIATLRHMDKVRAELRDGEKVICIK